MAEFPIFFHGFPMVFPTQIVKSGFAIASHRRSGRAAPLGSVP